LVQIGQLDTLFWRHGRRVLEGEFKNETVAVEGRVGSVKEHGETLWVTLLSSDQRARAIRLRVEPGATDLKLNKHDMVRAEGRLDCRTWDSTLQWFLRDVRITGTPARPQHLVPDDDRLTALRASGIHPPPVPADALLRAVALITAQGSDGEGDVRRMLKGEDAIRIIPFYIKPLVASRIAQAIREAQSSEADVIAITRGGGGAQELAEFDDVSLSAAIQRSRKPILVGVGHKSDKIVCSEFASERWNFTPTELGKWLKGHNHRVRSRRRKRQDDERTEAERQQARKAHDELVADRNRIRRRSRLLALAAGALLVTLLGEAAASAFGILEIRLRGAGPTLAAPPAAQAMPAAPPRTKAAKRRAGTAPTGKQAPAPPAASDPSVQTTTN
jgi:exonuclease VII large subunit